MKLNGELHCGACGEQFDRGVDLMTHLESCNVAKILLPMVWTVWGGRDHIHETAAFIVAVRKSIPLIRKYARAVASDMDTIRRAEIHRELCDSLGLSRKDFQPFESSKIKEIPDQEQAESIIWNAISRTPSRLGMIKSQGISL